MDDSNEQQMLQLNPVIELELLFHCPNSSCICSFKKEHLLTKHMKKCDDTKKQQFICTNVDCGKVYKNKNKNNLRQHVKDCGQIFTCDNPGCAKSFNTESDLSQHLRVCGGDSCRCGYVAHTLRNYFQHQTICKVSFLILFSFKPQKINSPRQPSSQYFTDFPVEVKEATFTAAREGNLLVVQKQLEGRHHLINLVDTNDCRNTILHLACEHHHLTLVTWLLQQQSR